MLPILWKLPMAGKKFDPIASLPATPLVYSCLISFQFLLNYRSRHPICVQSWLTRPCVLLEPEADSPTKGLTNRPEATAWALFLEQKELCILCPVPNFPVSCSSLQDWYQLPSSTAIVRNTENCWRNTVSPGKKLTKTKKSKLMGCGDGRGSIIENLCQRELCRSIDEPSAAWLKNYMPAKDSKYIF